MVVAVVVIVAAAPSDFLARSDVIFLLSKCELHQLSVAANKRKGASLRRREIDLER